MQRIPIILSAVTVMVLMSGARASADALSEYLGPRELALGGAMRAEAPGALSITLNPAGLALTRELVFEGNYGHGFGSGADVFTVSGCDSTVPVPGCFYYRHFRTSLDSAVPAGLEDRHRVHEGGGTFARTIADRIFLGVGVKYVKHTCEGGCDILGGDEDSSGFAVDAGAIVQPIQILRLGVVGYNLAGASTLYPRAIGAGITARPVPSLGLAFDGVWNLDGADDQTTARYGGGLEYFFSASSGQTGFPIRLGALFDEADDSTYLSAGLGVVASTIALDVGASKQFGGDGLMVQAGLRVFGPRQPTGAPMYQ